MTGFHSITLIHLAISRLAHQMLAVLGGKAPHNHGVFIGGITTQATAEKVVHIDSILQKITVFIDEKMIPDVYDIAHYYPDYFRLRWRIWQSYYPMVLLTIIKS